MTVKYVYKYLHMYLRIFPDYVWGYQAVKCLWHFLSPVYVQKCVYLADSLLA